MNKIDRNDVYANVIDWVCNLDGYDYAIGGILENLPCPFDDFNMCDKYNTKMDEVIGSRIEIDVHKIVIGDKAEFDKLHKFANDLTDKIVEKHNEFVKIAENN